MNKILLIVCFIALALSAQAQTVTIAQNLHPVSAQATHTIAGYTAAQLDEADNANKPVSISYGRLFPAQFTPYNSGEWLPVKGGKVWRLAVKANSALGIAIIGKVKTLPQGAKLTIGSTNGKETVNTYTASDFVKQNIISTETVVGDEAMIEYFEPNGTKEKVNFTIERIVYVYKNEPKNETTLNDFGGSGKCQVNVNCPEGDEYKNQRNAVVYIRIVTDFVTQYCTGTLVNTTKNDYKPYILTAMHCGLRGGGDSLIHDSLFNYWTFHFNYQSPTCTNPSFDTTENRQVITGAMVRAHSDDRGGDYGSDFLLVELSQNVPKSFEAFYCGWNIDTVNNGVFNRGVCIHHPRADVKKISTYDFPATPSIIDVNKFPYKTHWEVFWTATPNGKGVTEPGSSGSPLFDSLGRIIGTLTGGNSTCTNNGTDKYGRMDWHWTKNGSAINRQLKPWLDPDNTGAKTLNGRYDWYLNTQETEQNPLSLYPNPTQGVLYFSAPALSYSDNTTVTIANTLGQTVATPAINGPSITINQLPAGVYFIFISEGENHFTSKFIKQ